MKLMEIMQNRKMTYRELSEKSGVPIRTLEDINRRGSCNLITATMIANALNMRLGTFAELLLEET